MLEQIESFCMNFYWPGELTVTDVLVPPQISLYMIYILLTYSGLSTYLLSLKF